MRRFNPIVSALSALAFDGEMNFFSDARHIVISEISNQKLPRDFSRLRILEVRPGNDAVLFFRFAQHRVFRFMRVLQITDGTGATTIWRFPETKHDSATLEKHNPTSMASFKAFYKMNSMTVFVTRRNNGDRYCHWPPFHNNEFFTPIPSQGETTMDQLGFPLQFKSEIIMQRIEHDPSFIPLVDASQAMQAISIAQ